MTPPQHTQKKTSYQVDVAEITEISSRLGGESYLKRKYILDAKWYL